jgi:hypothetical protein
MSRKSFGKSVVIAVLAIGIVLTAAGLYRRNRAAGVNARQPSAEPAPVRSGADDKGGIPAGNVAASAAAGKARVCSLISLQEMENILGGKVRNVVATATTCEYRASADHAVEIESTWQGGKDAMAAAKIYNAGVFSRVPDLGDETYFQAAGIMHARRGDVYIVINARAWENAREVETQIVRRAVDRMVVSETKGR